VAAAKCSVRDVARPTARAFEEAGDRSGGYVHEVVEGWRGRGAGGGAGS